MWGLFLTELRLVRYANNVAAIKLCAIKTQLWRVAVYRQAIKQQVAMTIAWAFQINILNNFKLAATFCKM